MGVNMTPYYDVMIVLDDHTTVLIDESLDDLNKLRNMLTSVLDAGGNINPHHATKRAIADILPMLRRFESLRVQFDYAVEKCERLEAELLALDSRSYENVQKYLSEDK